MEVLSPEFQTHLEELARQAGKKAALEVVEGLNIGESQSNLMNIQDLAKKTGMSVSTILRRRDEGIIVGYRFGGRVVYNLDEVLASMQSTRRA